MPVLIGCLVLRPAGCGQLVSEAPFEQQLQATSVTSAKQPAATRPRTRPRTGIRCRGSRPAAAWCWSSPRIWPRHHRNGAELAHRPRIAQNHAVQQPPADVRQRHAPERAASPRRPAIRAASSSSVPCSCISGISSRATNGNVTKMVASTMPGSAKMIWMSWRLQPRPEPALRAEQQHLDQARR